MGNLLARIDRHRRIRKKIQGTAERPRLCVSRSLENLYVQLIDDVAQKTLLGLSTLSKEFRPKKDAGNVKGAEALGKLFAKRAAAQKISRVVFDRGGSAYHGRIKAFAGAAREGGLLF